MLRCEAKKREDDTTGVKSEELCNWYLVLCTLFARKAREQSTKLKVQSTHLARVQTRWQWLNPHVTIMSA